MSEFFHMGGYAFYVWSSYAIALVVLVANVALPVWRRKQLFRELGRRQRRQERRRRKPTTS